MKKVIQGKVYDSEKATLIGRRTSGASNDLNYIGEELYRTKSGLYFIDGWGGANTKYAECVGGNSWGGSEKILPISYAEAIKWAEEYLSAEEYIVAFGEPSEDEDAVTISTIVSAKTKSKINRIKSESGKTIRQIIEESVEKF